LAQKWWKNGKYKRENEKCSKGVKLSVEGKRVAKKGENTPTRKEDSGE